MASGWSMALYAASNSSSIGAAGARVCGSMSAPAVAGEVVAPGACHGGALA